MFNRKVIFKGSPIFHFYVSLPECKLNSFVGDKSEQRFETLNRRFWGMKRGNVRGSIKCKGQLWRCVSCGNGDRWFEKGSVWDNLGWLGSACHVSMFFFVFLLNTLVHSILLVTDGFHFPIVLLLPLVTWQREIAICVLNKMNKISSPIKDDQFKIPALFDFQKA